LIDGRTSPVKSTSSQLPFDHPLYIMYSSGTTGLPKCIVQSQGGVLINQLKELVLHDRRAARGQHLLLHDLRLDDVELARRRPGVGATVVLFDGSPFHPDASP
jgi:acetoacetyl-CoA synthetase